MKKVLITGANGFIAKHIARTLSEAGFFVLGTSRKPAHVDYFNEIVSGRLGEPLRDCFENRRIDAVIHCAYDRQDIDNKKNAEGTLIWAKQARINNVGMQIFMSSLSADEKAVSPYGQRKFELERWFLRNNQVVIRLGLVVGNGGLFYTMISMVKRSPVLPLIDMGRTLTYISDVDVISNVVCDFLVNAGKYQRGKIFYLQQQSPVCVGDILREIRDQFKLFCIFVPIPYFVLSCLLTVVEKLNFMKFSINTNNLKGMRQFNQKKFESDLNSLGYSDIPMEILIKRLQI